MLRLLHRTSSRADPQRALHNDNHDARIMIASCNQVAQHVAKVVASDSDASVHRLYRCGRASCAPSFSRQPPTPRLTRSQLGTLARDCNVRACSADAAPSLAPRRDASCTRSGAVEGRLTYRTLQWADSLRRRQAHWAPPSRTLKSGRTLLNRPNGLCAQGVIPRAAPWGIIEL